MLRYAPPARSTRSDHGLRSFFPQASDCGFSNSPLRTQGGLQATKSKIRRPVARQVARQVCVAHRSKKKSSFSGEAISGTQRCLEARFSTIAVYDASVFFLLVEDDRVSAITVCLPGYYRGSQYVFLILFLFRLRPPGRDSVKLQ